MIYAYLTPDFRKHISWELWHILFVWSFSVMRFLHPCSNTWCPSVRFLQSATPLTVTTQLIDVKLYNVLEIRFIKNSLRSTMGEESFSALLLLYVHKDIEIDISKVVEMYARQYPRRMLLYNPLSEWLVWNDLETIVYM